MCVCVLVCVCACVCVLVCVCVLDNESTHTKGMAILGRYIYCRPPSQLPLCPSVQSGTEASLCQGGQLPRTEVTKGEELTLVLVLAHRNPHIRRSEQRDTCFFTLALVMLQLEHTICIGWKGNAYIQAAPSCKDKHTDNH